MKGLEIKFRDKVIQIASDGIFGVNAVKRNKELYFNINGLDKNNMVLQWKADTQLEAGDEIEVSVREVSLITEPEKKFPFGKMDSKSEILTDEQILLIYQEKLAYFQALENKLKDKGLIQ